MNFYIKKSYSPIPRDPGPEIPEPYCSLLKMQNVAGKWQSLKNVLLCLDMPAVFTLVEYSDWEVATGKYVRTFALAFSSKKLFLLSYFILFLMTSITVTFV